MNDIDDVLRRTYASPDASPAARPPAARLHAALRDGRRRRARRRAAAGAGTAVLAVGLLLGVVALRNGGDGGDGIPADTTSAVSAATTLPGATTAPSSPGSSSPGSSSPGPVAATAGLPQFVAVSTDGRIEVWARTGLVRTVEACAGVTTPDCAVTSAAVGADQVWFSRRVGGSGDGTRLLAAPLSGTSAPTVVFELGDPDGAIIGVAGDGRPVVLINDALVWSRTGGPEVIARGVTGAALSGDGRIAYSGADGSIGVRPLAGGGERTVDLAAAGYRPPEGSAVRVVDWSPDRARLLLQVERAEDLTWLTVDLGAEPAARPLSDTRRVPACWTGVDTVAIGAWVPSPGADTRGAIALVSAVSGDRTGSIGGSFGESLAFACRGDGAVALVQHQGADWTGGGDLVVVGRDGASTRLGTGYATVLSLGSGPVALLDPATLPAPTTTVAPVLPVRAADAFAALTATGDLEVWTPAGKARTIAVGVNDCEPSAYATCGPADRVDTVAITERSIWYGGNDGTLWRAALDGSATPVAVSRAEDRSIVDIAVSADDSVAWIVRWRAEASGRLVSALVRRERGVETEIADGAASVALSPDGLQLAYSINTFTGDSGGPLEGSVIGELVVRDLRTGVERRQPWRVREGFPGALVDLRWSPDGTRLLVAASWEGQRDFVVPADLSTSLDDPAYLGSGGIEARSCWLAPATVARGEWSIVYAEGPSVPADVTARAVPGTGSRPYGVSVYGDTLACRSDGSVALVDKGTAFERPGELVVVRPDGRRTVLGRGYAALFPG